VKGEPEADEHQSEVVPVVNVQVVGEDIGVPAAFSIPLTTTLYVVKGARGASGVSVAVFVELS